jgi:hypothetical protein
VDEVVGDLDTIAGAGERVGVGDIADDKLAPGALELPRPVGSADEAAGGFAGVGQGGRQPAADEAGCACDKRGRGDGG